MKSSIVICLLLMFILFLPLPGTAGEDGRTEAFSYNIRTLLFVDAQYPSHSTQNPDNAFLQLYRYSTEVDLRPDLYWEENRVSAVFKPRFNTAHYWWEDGITHGRTDSTSRAFVNEWRVQARTSSELFLSFGKEKLLWGPSFLASPSNILFKDMEKIDPKIEVEGKYLAKAIVVPNNTLTVTVLTETQKEENGLQETLKPLRAVKVDVLGKSYQISMIGYEQQNERFRLGSYGQWTASDALLLYYDGVIMRGTDALYPVRDQTNPLGDDLVKKNDRSDKLLGTVTAGGAYTFLSGPTVSVEFLYNGQGYNDQEATDYYRLRQQASSQFFNPALSGPALTTLAETLNTGLPFLRRYYLMGQYQVREIKNALDVILRYVYGLEEHAGQASSILEWRISDRMQLFNINTVAVAQGKETEFNSILDKSFILGIEAHF
jgi:hypothetical protein